MILMDFIMLFLVLAIITFGVALYFKSRILAVTGIGIILFCSYLLFTGQVIFYTGEDTITTMGDTTKVSPVYDRYEDKLFPGVLTVISVVLLAIVLFSDRIMGKLKPNRGIEPIEKNMQMV